MNPVLQSLLTVVIVIYVLRAIVLLKHLVTNYYNIVAISTKIKNFILTLAINIVLQEVVIVTTLYVIHLAYQKGIFTWL